MKVAVIGSRNFPALQLVRLFVAALPFDAMLVSGGAFGVDKTAEMAAKDRRLSRLILEPAARPDAPRNEYVAALFERNREVCRVSDEVHGFWTGASSGTRQTLEFAHGLGRPTWWHKVDGTVTEWTGRGE